MVLQSLPILNSNLGYILLCLLLPPIPSSIILCTAIFSTRWGGGLYPYNKRDLGPHSHMTPASVGESEEQWKVHRAYGSSTKLVVQMRLFHFRQPLDNTSLCSGVATHAHVCIILPFMQGCGCAPPRFD